MGFLSAKTTAHIRCLLQILLEFLRNCVDSSNSDLDDICASAGVRSHVTLEGRLAVAGVCCGVSGGRLSDVKKLITLLVIHTLPQPISGPIQIHSYTHLHFTYRTPARV